MSIDWGKFGTAILCTVLALAIIASSTVMIVTGHVNDIPESYENVLTGLIFGGIVGAALVQGKAVSGGN